MVLRNLFKKSNSNARHLPELTIQRWMQMRDPMLNFYLSVENLVFRYWPELTHHRLSVYSLSAVQQDAVGLLAVISGLVIGRDKHGDVYLTRNADDQRFEPPRISVRYRIPMSAITVFPKHRLHPSV